MGFALSKCINVSHKAGLPVRLSVCPSVRPVRAPNSKTTKPRRETKPGRNVAQAWATSPAIFSSKDQSSNVSLCLLMFVLTFLSSWLRMQTTKPHYE